MPKRRKKRTPNPVQRNLTAEPRTPNQRDYIKAIRESSITICVGLAGTGKTFLATSEAVKAIKDRKVNKLIISRPVIEAGESLGYLPGRLEEKAKPYLVPIFDALKEFLSYQEIAQLQNRGKLEICPLAYMRGRTFKEAFVILDEAQNATTNQIKMFLTRLGSGSKAIICGDPRQSDIHTGDLAACAKALQGIKGIEIVELTKEDVIRHPLISVIAERLENITEPEHNGNGHNRLKQMV